jgi:hypothetical protein
VPSTTWTPDELAAWLAVAVDDRRGHVGAGRNNRMRRSAFADTERERLDLDNTVLEIGDTRVVAGKAEESDGKTESGRRTISLDPLTVAYLRRHLAMLDTEREAFGDSYHECRVARLPPGRAAGAPRPDHRPFNKLVDRAGASKSACTTCGIRRRDRSMQGLTRRSWPTGSGTPTWLTRWPSTPTSRPARIEARPERSPGCCWGPGGRARSAGPQGCAKRAPQRAEIEV